MGRGLVAAFCVLSLCGAVCAQQNAPRTYAANGKTIKYNCNLTVFEPPVPIQPDPARPNQDNAINCTILFMSSCKKET
jgi:hypothetical protein